MLLYDDDKKANFQYVNNVFFSFCVSKVNIHIGFRSVVSIRLERYPTGLALTPYVYLTVATFIGPSFTRVGVLGFI